MIVQKTVVDVWVTISEPICVILNIKFIHKTYPSTLMLFFKKCLKYKKEISSELRVCFERLKVDKYFSSSIYESSWKLSN